MTLDLVGERIGRVLVGRRLVRLPAGRRAVDHQAEAHVAEVRLEPLRQRGQARRGHDGDRAAVLDDVAGLVGLEVPVDRRGRQPDSLGAPEDLEVPLVVLHQDGHVVTGPQARGAK